MIPEFIQYLQAIKGYSPNTARAYHNDLISFVTWAKEHKEDARWSRIDRSDIDAFIIYQEAKGLKPATTNRQIAAISTFYNYLKRENLIKENPCKYESRRKIGTSIPKTIPVADIKEAYDHAQGFVKTMLGVISSTGIRIQEFLDIEAEDINTKENTLTIRGKGNKERIVYLSNDTIKLLISSHQDKEPHGRLFNIDQRHARYLLWQALQQYTNARQLSPHVLRHTLATNMAKQGVNVATIAQILGHQDIKTTQKYIDLAEMETKQACLQNSIIK